MISIIMGAYNEENRICGSLHHINEFLRARNSDFEIIVIDDGSTDRTAQLVAELARSIPFLRMIHYDKNRGKGYALRTGVLASKGGSAPDRCRSFHAHRRTRHAASVPIQASYR